MIFPVFKKVEVAPQSGRHRGDRKRLLARRSARPKSVGQIVERIEDEIVRIDRLVGDILKLSRIEAGEIAGIEEDVDKRS
jgi:signal transduction histidine kinase